MLRSLILTLLPIFIGANFVPGTPLNFFNFSPFTELFQRDYTAFTCWLSCSERATVMCYYLGFKDEGNAARPSSFYYDPSVSRDCQQKSTSSYESVHSDWDRGHMVAANHMDQNEVTIKESMYITNIMPQTSQLNKQSFLYAEELFECYRDIVNLKTIVGIIMGNNASNDFFIESHGVRSPDYYWRIIEKETDGDVIAWIFPNDETATNANIDKFLVRISDIESRAGFIFSDFTTVQKNKLASTTWTIPKDCDKSRLAKLADDGN